MDKQDEHWFLNGKKVVQILFKNEKTKMQMLSKSSHQIINGVSITLEASFGCLQQPIKKNCMFVNDDTLMFISGKHIVLYDIIRKRQTYIMKGAEDEQVQALNFFVTNSQKLLIGLAFKSTNKILPTVKVYNRKKKRFYQLVHSHLLPNSSVQEIQFINQGKSLISLSHSEEGFGISLFSIHKEVSISYTPLKVKVNQFEIINDLEFFLVGSQTLQLFKYQLDINGLEMMADLYNVSHYEQNEHIIDCCYIAEKKMYVLTTTNNQLLLLKGDNLIFKYKIYQNSFSSYLGINNKEKKQIVEEDVVFSISSICKTNKGFIIGLNGKPVLQVYEIDNNTISLVGSYQIKVENIYGINQVHLAADEMYAALTVIQFNQSAYQITYAQKQPEQALSCDYILEHFQGKLELFTFNLAIVEALRSVQKDPFEALFEKGVHKGAIFGVATTPMRSLIASVCEDKTIKFWDYSNDFKELFSHQFHESPLCVAVHPLSFQCSIGFKDGMRIYFILDDEIRLVHTENTKSCNAIAYSEGGHILAAANANFVNLIDPLTYQIVHVFNNHQTNLKEILFVDKDSLLISQCAFGVLYAINLLTGERLIEHSQKANKYYCLYYDYYYDLVIGVSDQRIKIYNDKGQNLALELDTSPTQFTSICISHQYNTIFFGTTQGSIRIYSYPFYHFNPKTMEYIEIPVHQLGVSQIKLSPDNSFLITSSIDGSIFFSKIKQYKNGEEVNQLELISQGDLESKLTNTFALNNLCLISQQQQETRRDQIKELEYKLQNFKSDIDDAKEIQSNSNDQQLERVKDENKKLIATIREQLSSTIQQSDYNTSKLKLDTIELRKTSRLQIEQLEKEQSDKLLSLYKVRDELSDQFQQVKVNQEKQLSQIKQEYQSSIQQVEDEYQQKYDDLFKRFKDAMDNMKLDQNKFKEVLQQGENDYETFFKDSQQKLKSKLEKYEKNTEELRKSISSKTQENERLNLRKEFLDNMIRDTTEQVSNLGRELINYQEKHRNMKNELKEKEKLINQREQQIKDFRLKNVHLQNFQKVYDYRVNTLKDEREPLMDHLKNMEKHVKNLYNELTEESGLKQQREEDEEKLKSDIKSYKMQLKSAENVLALSNQKMENFRFHVSQLLKQDVSKWKDGLDDLYKQLQKENSKAINIKNQVFQETLRDMQKDPIQQQIDQTQQIAIYKELQNQKQFLSKKLQNFEENVKYQLQERQDAYYTIQNTNDKLIKQCTALREKKQRLKEYIDKQNKAYREIKRELNSQGIEIPEESDSLPFMKTHATTFSQLTRTPGTVGTQSQQQFRKKIPKLQ